MGCLPRKKCSLVSMRDKLDMHIDMMPLIGEDVGKF